MSARNEDFLFAQEAQTLGYVTEAQVEEGFLLQARMTDELQIDERLAVILVKRGWLADEQARRVYGIIEPEGARSQIEGYRLIQKVGRGAMGTVYKARHKGLNRIVAIKILRRDLAEDKTQIERLKREAKLLADLDHRNIVRAFDAGESNGFPYLVMEFVEGETLRDKISREGTIDDDEAIRIIRALADALETARRMGVVHRDVKPGNILISKNGTPKLMDLGLAKGPIDAGLTQHGATVGTPQFMSPEQAESPDKADTRSDIYSLGATLYAMVTGRPPFSGTTLAEIITKVMSHQPVPPRVRNPDVSPEVSHLIERMMLKDASLRYATPALVIEDIDMIRGGQSIIPRGFQGNWEAYLLRKRFLEWRKRILVGLAAALVLGFGAFIYLDKKEKDIARTDAASIARRLLQEIPGVAAGDTPPALTGRIAELEAGNQKLESITDRANIPHPQRQEITDKINALKQARMLLEKCAKLKGRIATFRATGNWTGALAEAQDHASEMRASEPARVCWERLVAGLREGSEAARTAALGKVGAMPVADIDDFLAKHAARLAVYEKPWIPLDRKAYAKARAAAQSAHDKARQVGAFLGEEFIARFVPDRVAPLVADYTFYKLRTRFDDASGTLRQNVDAIVNAWPLVDERESTRTLLLGESGLVTYRIGRVEEDIDRRVEAAWNDLFKRLDSMAPDAALDDLKRFFNGAARGNVYPRLEHEARAEHARRKAAADERIRRARIAFQQVRDGILRQLRRGDPRRLRTAAEKELARDLLNGAQREDVAALAEAATALEALHEVVLRWLQGRLAAEPKVTLRNVHFRGQGGSTRVAKSWVLQGVDLKQRQLSVHVPRGELRGVQQIRIQHVALRTLRAWLAQTGSGLSPLHEAMLEVATSPTFLDRPGLDLRPLLERYRALQDRFGEDPPGPQWRRLIGEIVQELQDAQGLRSDEAVRNIELLRREIVKAKRWKRLVEMVDEMLDPKGRLLYTAAVNKNRADLESKRRFALEELARSELRRLFHGDVQPSSLPGGETDILFTFDDVQQLQNFERGFARWETSVLLGGAAVTPGAKEGGRLYVLPGVQGLLRDRPLSLISMFDPAKPMMVEVKIHVLRGSSMLAFDLDGVQIAICSFDPSLWKRRFRSEAPLLVDEDKRPEFDFYGMGRGIAFHDGPHFGRDFPYGNWDWAAAGQGRNFVRLKQRAVIEKAQGRLFAFVPAGRSVLVRVVRDTNFMTLYVDDKKVYEGENLSWRERGRSSPTDKRIRNGSGRIQILTWSPLLLDDLRVRGTITDAWRDARRAAVAESDKKAAAPEKAK